MSKFACTTLVRWVATFCVLIPTTLRAHEEGLGGAGFLTGLLHPALGLDHLLAMLSVGVLSTQIGGKAIWYVPGLFVFVMVIGSILGLQAIQVPLVEFGIGLSVLVLGTIIATYGFRASTGIAIACVAVFAIFHGHAHGTEMPQIAEPMLYGAGFVIGTATIHLIGVGIGLLSRKVNTSGILLRSLGGIFAVCGLVILTAA